MAEKKIFIEDVDQRLLFGFQRTNLELIEAEFPVEITARGCGPAATGCRPDKHTDNSPDCRPDNHRGPAGSTLQAALGFDRLWGPYSISSRWWSRERSREYYYAEDRFGSLLWLYFDTVRRQWLKSGSVE